MRLISAAWSFFGGSVHHLQHAIDPVAQTQPFFQRFDVNIAGPQAVGFQDHQIHQLDDVRVLARGGGVVAVLALLDLQLVPRVAADQRVDHVRGIAVVAFDRDGDLVHRRDDRLDLVTQFLAQRVDRIEVEGVRERDAQMPAVQAQGHDAEAMRHLA